MWKTRNRVHRNGGTRKAVQQVSNCAARKRKGQGRAGRCASARDAGGGEFTAEEAAALDWIAHQLDWETPEELESAAEDILREAEDFRLAAGALRRTGNVDWLWSIAPDLAVAAAARGDRPFVASHHSPITAEFVRLCGALYGSARFFGRLEEQLRVATAPAGFAAEVKLAWNGITGLNRQMLDLFNKVNRAGLLAAGSRESAGAQ
jgi:hypothetical protein